MRRATTLLLSLVLLPLVAAAEDSSDCGSTADCAAVLSSPCLPSAVGSGDGTGVECASALLGPAAELGGGGAGRILAADLRAYLTGPITMRRRGWARFGAGLAIVGAVSLLDQPLRDEVRGMSTADTQQVAELIRPIGQEGSIALLGALWALGKARDNYGLRAMAAAGLEASLLTSVLTVPLIKEVVGRERPRAGADSTSFDRAGQSFPSGETAQAFAVASVVSVHTHKRWVKGIAWSLAAATAWQRMELDGHWASDVTASALIGTAVGRWVVRQHAAERGERAAWWVAPTVGDGTIGLAVAWSP